MFEHQRFAEPLGVLGDRVARLNYGRGDRDREPVELAAGWWHYHDPPFSVSRI